MYYFYEISTLNDYDWLEKEYKTIEYIIFDVLKNIENNNWVSFK